MNSRKNLVVVLLVSALVLSSSMLELRSRASAIAIALTADTITVTDPADSGPGTLRQALLNAGSGTIINFDTSIFPPDTPRTIYLESVLPDITQGSLTIDASDAGVILDGSNIADGYYRAFTITSDDNIIRGLQIVNFPYDGILLSNANNNIIGGDRVVGNGPMGQGNLISGNGGHGIQVYQDCANNLFIGNYIGTNLAGTSAWPNAYSGIALQGAPGPHHNIIGGNADSIRNVLSGNGNDGIRLSDGANENTIAGNFIGVDAGGTVKIPNNDHGIVLVSGARSNHIGGSTVGERNVISGNNSEGILLNDTATVSNTISGNYIGTDATGSYGIGNGGGGIDIHTSGYNIIGGSNATPGGACTGECNLISGNTGDNGISIFDDGASYNIISGNYIGTNISGTTTIGNSGSGIFIRTNSRHNVIGGDTPAARNVISGNSNKGISIQGEGAINNIVKGNYIGTNSSGDAPLGNRDEGVLLLAAEDNIIGGNLPGEGNLISGNNGQGIGIVSKGGLQHFPDLAGLYPEYTGVFDSISFPDTYGPFMHQDSTIPTTSTGDPFYDVFAVRFTGQIHISTSGVYEFWLGSDDGSLLYIDGEKIIDRNFETGFSTSYGSHHLLAGSYPIEIDFFESYGSAGLTFEVSGPDTVSFTTNDSSIAIAGLLGEFFLPEEKPIPSRRNVIVGNLVGTDASGTKPVSNQGNGIHIENSEASIIGGPTQAERNIINYNGGNGIVVRGSLAVSNTIQNNWIGVDSNSTGGLDPRDLVVADDGTVFMADFGRGVVRSTNNTTSWEVVTQGLTTLDIEQIAVSPNFTTTRHIWAWGAGTLHVSENAGTNWVSLGNILPGDLAALEVSPHFENDQTLLAGMLWPKNAGLNGGIYKSTDGGESWNLVSSYTARTIAFSPNFATDHRVLAGDWGLQRSTDSGDTWIQDTSGVLGNSMSDIVYAPDAQTVFFTSHNCGNNGVYISTDGGQTWIGSGSGLTDCGSEWQIAVSPNFINDGLVLAAEDSMYRSADGSANWNWSGNGAFGSRARALTFATSDTAYFANFNGVFGTSDGGTNWTWAAANLADRGNGGRGVEISGGAGATQVISNVIARNAWGGIGIWDPGPEGSLLTGNLVGLAPDGVSRAGNGGTGIQVDTSYVTITHNIAAANGHGGIRSYRSNIHHLIIADNRVGTDVYGTIAVGNSYDGISLQSSWNVLRSNLVSGNWGGGIFAAENVTTPHHTLLAGNLVGVDATGTRALPNRGDGITISGSYITVGGTNAEDRNIISGNQNHGLVLNREAHHNTIQGNYIGTDATGLTAIGNWGYGVVLWDGAHNNILGGDHMSERNIISGNRYGIFLWVAHENTIQGNFVGTNANGVAALGNEVYGIRIGGGSASNLIGGVNPSTDGVCMGPCNLVSGNKRNGIILGQTTSNTITGNYIGSNVNGAIPLGNGASGIFLVNGASNTQIGGSVGTMSSQCTGECNLILGNAGAGIEINGSDAIRNTIAYNSIYSNDELGISLHNGGNTELPTPVIMNYDLVSGISNGTACTNCIVAIFSDEHGEGRWFEGTVVADSSGNWSFAKGSAFHGPELTATSTDAAGNTSEFGQDWPANPPPPPVIAAPVCGVTNQSRPTFQGIAQMGSTVNLGTNGLTLGSTTTNDQNQWNHTAISSLYDATYVVTATATTIWGTSESTHLSLTVNSTLCYDPVGVTFTQHNVTQHPHDNAGCADPSQNLSVTLWPNTPVTLSVPVSTPTATVYVEVNAIRYDLSDPDSDGIFTAGFNTPSAGNTVILLVVESDGDTQTMQIGTTIDPDGYVYDAQLTQSTGITQTLGGITVTLYVSDTVRNRWVLWNAGPYGQQNPQVTESDGYFAFFTPPGDYRLIADGQALGYQLYESPVLTVVDKPIRNNIALTLSKTTMRYVYLPLVLRKEP